MANKRCPKCKIQYSEQDNFCRKCGAGLEKDFNRCSEQKFPRCLRLTFADDDGYCPCCGAVTTYEKERREWREKIIESGVLQN